MIYELICIFCLGTITKDNGFGLFRVSGQHPPVNESSVPDVWVADVLRSHCQKIADQSLELVWVLEIDFDCRAQYLELNFALLTLEVGDPFFEGCHGDVVDLVGVLCENPDGGLFGLTFGGEVEESD